PTTLAPPYATPSSIFSPDYRRSDARIVENGFATSGGLSKSAKVVLGRVLINAHMSVLGDGDALWSDSGSCCIGTNSAVCVGMSALLHNHGPPERSRKMSDNSSGMRDADIPSANLISYDRVVGRTGLNHNRAPGELVR